MVSPPRRRCSDLGLSLAALVSLPLVVLTGVATAAPAISQSLDWDGSDGMPAFALLPHDEGERAPSLAPRPTSPPLLTSKERRRPAVYPLRLSSRSRADRRPANPTSSAASFLGNSGSLWQKREALVECASSQPVRVCVRQAAPHPWATDDDVWSTVAGALTGGVGGGRGADGDGGSPSRSILSRIAASWPFGGQSCVTVSKDRPAHFALWPRSVAVVTARPAPAARAAIWADPKATLSALLDPIAGNGNASEEASRSLARPPPPGFGCRVDDIRAPADRLLAVCVALCALSLSARLVARRQGPRVIVLGTAFLLLGIGSLVLLAARQLARPGRTAAQATAVAAIAGLGPLALWRWAGRLALGPAISYLAAAVLGGGDEWGGGGGGGSTDDAAGGLDDGGGVSTSACVGFGLLAAAWTACLSAAYYWDAGDGAALNALGPEAQAAAGRARDLLETATWAGGAGAAALCTRDPWLAFALLAALLVGRPAARAILRGVAEAARAAAVGVRLGCAAGRVAGRGARAARRAASRAPARVAAAGARVRSRSRDVVTAARGALAGTRAALGLVGEGPRRRETGVAGRLVTPSAGAVPAAVTERGRSRSHSGPRRRWGEAAGRGARDAVSPVRRWLLGLGRADAAAARAESPGGSRPPPEGPRAWRVRPRDASAVAAAAAKPLTAHARVLSAAAAPLPKVARRPSGSGARAADAAANATPPAQFGAAASPARDSPVDRLRAVGSTTPRRRRSVSGLGAGPAAAASPGADVASPWCAPRQPCALVRSGKCVNPKTGREIRIGAGVHASLVEAGWTLDETTGEMTKRSK